MLVLPDSVPNSTNVNVFAGVKPILSKFKSFMEATSTSTGPVPEHVDLKKLQAKL